MGWKFEYKDSFKDDLNKIVFNHAQDVLLYLNREIGAREDPRSVGSEIGDLWRYKTNGMAITVKIVDEESKIIVYTVIPSP